MATDLPWNPDPAAIRASAVCVAQSVRKAPSASGTSTACRFSTRYTDLQATCLPVRLWHRLEPRASAHLSGGGRPAGRHVRGEPGSSTPDPIGRVRRHSQYRRWGENRGFRPTAYAIPYHANFGYPSWLNRARSTATSALTWAAQLNRRTSTHETTWLTVSQEMPVQSVGQMRRTNSGTRVCSVEYERGFPSRGPRFRVFGIWRALQSGVYALALEPTRRFGAEGTNPNSMTLDVGETMAHAIELGPIAAAKT